MTIAEAAPEETSSPGPFSMNREGGLFFGGQTSVLSGVRPPEISDAENAGFF